MAAPVRRGRVLRLAHRRGDAPLAHLAAFSGVWWPTAMPASTAVRGRRVGGGLTEAVLRTCPQDLRRARRDGLGSRGGGAERIGRSTGSSATCTASRPDAAPASGRPARSRGRGAEGVCRDEPGQCRAAPTWPRVCATCWHAGRPHAGRSTTAVSPSTTTRPSGRCAVWRSAQELPVRGSEPGAERAAAFYTLIETAKMNGLDPEAYLARRAHAHTPITRQATGRSAAWNWMPTSEASRPPDQWIRHRALTLEHGRPAPVVLPRPTRNHAALRDASSLRRS